MIGKVMGAMAVGTALAASAYTYKICFHSPKKHNENPYTPVRGEQYLAVQDKIFTSSRIMANTEFEQVRIRSHDGLTLTGRFYAVREGAPLLLAFHGYRSMALRDCAGAFALGLKLGFNILAVDQRAHGQSQGRVITFGIKERFDCLSWAEYANKRFGSNVPIILSGLSMGAATVLMAADLDLPENVCCIMADCPYSTPADIIRKVGTDEGYPEKLVYPFIWLGGRIYGGFDLTQADAIRSVQKAKVPILLIHGEDDRFVPCEMSREILKNCASPARLHTFPGAGHGLSYMVDPQRYEQVCVDFMRTIPALQKWLNE